MPRSGWNEDNYIEEAGKLYQAEVGEPFKCAKCVPVVHKLPKFDPMIASVVSHSSPAGSADDDSIPSDVVRNAPRPRNVTNTAQAQGSKLARPVGMKKAKKLANLEQSSLKQQRASTGVTSTLMPGPTSSAAALLEDKTEMIGVTKELVAVFKVNTMLKQKDLQARQEERWMRMAEMYMSAGQKEKGLALLANLEESTSAISADVPSAINVEEGDKNLKDDTNSVLTSISASAEIPSANDGTPQNKDHNDSASSESGDSQYGSAFEKDCDAIAEV